MSPNTYSHTDASLFCLSTVSLLFSALPQHQFRYLCANVSSCIATKFLIYPYIFHFNPIFSPATYGYHYDLHFRHLLLSNSFRFVFPLSVRSTAYLIFDINCEIISVFYWLELLYVTLLFNNYCSILLFHVYTCKFYTFFTGYCYLLASCHCPYDYRPLGHRTKISIAFSFYCSWK